MLATSEIVYARATHGSVPIRIVNPRSTEDSAYEVLSCAGDVAAAYGSARSLIAALTGNPHHGLTFERYFGCPDDDPASLLPPGGGVLDLFTATKVRARGITARPARPTPLKKLQQGLTVASTVIEPRKLGIDIRARGHEIRKILFAGFGSWIMRSGYDPEDVLQEVYRGVLARNVGRCPFDERKSSFGHYIHLVCRCILSNHHRRESRRREVEQVGMPAPASMREDAEAFGGTVDAGAVADRMLTTGRDACESGDDGMASAVRRLGAHLDRKVRDGIAVDPIETKVAALLVSGLNRREIAEELGVSQGRVTNAITSLREHATDWV